MGKYLEIAKKAMKENNQLGSETSSPTNLDILNPVEVLDEAEIEALRGWMGACSNPKYQLSLKDSTLKAWQLLIESIISIKKRKTGIAL
tara:strand:+ start:59 stop:325 length:267 start_codon:yes stop_codon:yes gene_type:complete